MKSNESPGWDSARIATLGSERSSAVVDLTRALISAPSQNPPGDERGVAEVVRHALEGVPGVSLAIPSVRPERPNLVFLSGRSDRRTLVFAAHSDTVPVRGEWTHDPFEGTGSDGRIYGLGASDNKGAVAAMTLAFRTLVEDGLGEYGRLILVVNADEEAGGAAGIDVVSRYLREHESPDAAIVAEASGVRSAFEHLYVAARGASRFLITAGGTTTHSSLSSRAGVTNAIADLARLVRALEDRLELLSAPDELYGTAAELVPVLIEGGDGWGVIPGRASIRFDLRVAPAVQQDHAEASLRAAFKAAVRDVGVQAELGFPVGGLRWVGPSSVVPDELVVRCARDAWMDVFQTAPVLGGFPGGTDARVFGELGVPSLPALGPGALARAHSGDEYVETEELVTALQLYMGTAVRFLQDETGDP